MGRSIISKFYNSVHHIKIEKTLIPHEGFALQALYPLHKISIDGIREAR